jgi:hypothetical protein
MNCSVYAKNCGIVRLAIRSRLKEVPMWCMEESFGEEVGPRRDCCPPYASGFTHTAFSSSGTAGV